MNRPPTSRALRAFFLDFVAETAMISREVGVQHTLHNNRLENGRVQDLL